MVKSAEKVEELYNQIEDSADDTQLARIIIVSPTVRQRALKKLCSRNPAKSLLTSLLEEVDNETEKKIIEELLSRELSIKELLSLLQKTEDPDLDKRIGAMILSKPEKALQTKIDVVSYVRRNIPALSQKATEILQKIAPEVLREEIEAHTGRLIQSAIDKIADLEKSGKD